MFGYKYTIWRCVSQDTKYNCFQCSKRERERERESLGVLNHRDMQMYGEVEVEHNFLISAPDGHKWSVSRYGHFILGKTDPGAHWLRG
jgi:hypothetical protein